MVEQRQYPSGFSVNVPCPECNGEGWVWQDMPDTPEETKSNKEKYVKNTKDGTYSPLRDDGKIMVGLVITSLPKNAVCVGEFTYP